MSYTDMKELGYTDKDLLPVKAAKEVKKSNSTKKAEKKAEKKEE